MDRASFSNIEFHNYAQAPPNDTESGVKQDGRNCGTRAFKWIVSHPFLAAAATIGLLGAASAGIYGLTLLGAAAPVATALSSRNVTTETLATNISTTNISTTNISTTKAPTTEALTTEALTTKAPTTEALTTKAPTFRSEGEKFLNECKAICTFNAKSAECTGNPQVNPACCLGSLNSSYWMSRPNGEPVNCRTKSQACTNKSFLLSGGNSVFHSMKDFCQSKGWGKAIYRIP
ncbi:hypothetical protein [Endozoicomonas sp. ALE010]|uniref:hypothetical protein n=1 Tax=Endozoicomonas sp. ALE010 TaxID=3403081 RepID=UPI003BB53A79